MTHIRKYRRGLALVVVLLVLVVLGVLAATAALLGTSTQRQSVNSQKEVVLLHAAEGGLEEMKHQIIQDIRYGTAALPATLGVAKNAGGGYTLSMPGHPLAPSEYWWTFTEGNEPYSTNNLAGKASYTRPDGLVVPAGCVLAIVSAAGPGEPRPLRLAALLTDRWTDGIAADSIIDMRNSVIRDVHPNVGAQVRTNQPDSLPKGEKYAVQVGDVVGDVYCCLDSALIRPDPPSGNWSNHPNSPPVDLPNIPIDQLVQQASTSAAYRLSGDQIAQWSGGQLVIGPKKGGQPISVPADVYIDGSLTYEGSKLLPAGIRLFVQGEVTLNGGVRSGPDPDQPSYIFCTGSITVNGASTLRTHLLATDSLRINGNSNLDGFHYVRHGDIRVTGGGNGSIDGVLIARDNDRNDGDIRGRVETANYQVNTNLEYLEEFRAHFPTVSLRRLYTLSWWRLQ